MVSDTEAGRQAPLPGPETAQDGALPTTYEPKRIEERWYAYWESQGLFRGEVPAEAPGDTSPFSVVIPPPNITGSLHMGHALNNTLQDILVRYHRMRGDRTLWIPGTDHASIATQYVVEAELAKEGKTRWQLGRERFLERVWEWKRHSGGQITFQLRRLGASCDWSRERFTMDPGLSRAVRQVFVQLFEEGLIYRSDYIISWCPRCHTALSDLEVEHEEEDGRLWYLRYPLEDGTGDVVVATTRPETMLGDTGVAVHPDDARYVTLTGRRAILPLVGRRLPIVADAAVDASFGTGAVKVTPGHDPDDFEMGRRHGLPVVKVIDEDGRMTPEAGAAYAGQDRYACREQVVEALRRQGFLVKEQPHRHAVGHCYRCGTVVEPLVSKQWFVRMKPLADPAIAAVREGRIRFVPEHFAGHYFHWMEQVRDWCISRQLWWGHRIPVWYCQSCGDVFASTEETVTRCRRCGSTAVEQDPDVLDTWFSSALWPFSTMGWPEKTAELEFFYPTSVLVTAFDILFFWVARMVVMGLKFTGEVPFRHVMIHGLVRDALGRKMSKSLGNGVDPLEVIDEYGADALRFTLVNGVGIGNDVRWQPARVEASRNFANKLWNAARFALIRLEGWQPPHGDDPGREVAAGLQVADRWILSRLQRTVVETTRLMDRFDLGEAARVLYDFVWDEVCDWYIELVKPRLAGPAGPDREAARLVLWYVLEHSVRLLHPFMPFVTEEIWQRLPHHGPSVMVAEWPRESDRMRSVDPVAEAQMGTFIETVRAIRNVRAEKGVPVNRRIRAIVWAEGEARGMLAASAGDLARLAYLSHVAVEAPGAVRPEQAVPAVAGPSVEVFLPLADLLDPEQELRRLSRQLAELDEQMARWGRMLDNPEFTQRAPAAVVEATRSRQEEAMARRSRLLEQMEQLKQLV